jgi:hypothetical protein
MNLTTLLKGTPMYIARAPSIGFYEGLASQFPKLPMLDEPIRQLYIKAYPGDPFRNAQGAVGVTNEKMSDEFSGKRVIQRTWHDAESAVLTLLLFLLRCSPVDSQDESEEKLRHMQDIYMSIRNTSIGSLTDSRDILFQARRTKWSQFLHSGLSHLADPLAAICAAVLPEYEFLEPNDGIIHEIVLHEVLQRLLFQLYCDLRENPVRDIAFNKKLRPLPTDEGWKHTTTAIAESGSKFSSDVFGKVEVNSSQYVGESAEPSTVADPSAFSSPPLRKSKRKRKNERMFYQIL